MPDSNVPPIDPRYQKIWATIAAIPAGRVMSYGQVAAAAGLPKRARFVSRALREAPAELALPWHRVIRSDGTIAFAAGSRQHRLQTKLLKAEGAKVSGGKVTPAVPADSGDLDYELWAQD